MGSIWSGLKTIVLRIRTSFLLVPLLFAFGGLGLSVLTVWLDRSGLVSGLVKLIPGIGIDEEGARSVFSTIASGMLSVTGIVISLTFLALTMMSSQLGPRLLVFFMRDRTIKIVFGIFVGTIIYSLISMASVGMRGDATFAPHLTFAVSILLALVSLGAMVHFVDHIAHSMQADVVVEQLARDCDAAIGRAIRDDDTDASPTEEEAAAFATRFGKDPHRWEATRSGYLASVDYEDLIAAAKDHDAAVALYFRVNDFVFDGQILAAFLCDDDRVDAIREALENTIALSASRTPAQQINFEMSALTEVALRALSPGINDPFTAAACVNHLGNTLSRIATAAPKLRLLKDGDGEFRVLRPADNLPFFLDRCIAPIIEAAEGSPIALHSLIRTLNRLAELAHREIDVETVARQREALRRTIAESIQHPTERSRQLAMIDPDPDDLPPV